MRVETTELPGVLLIEPRVFEDDRGYFFEVWQEPRYREAGIEQPFVQDNEAASTRGVLRGLHFQHPHAQGKLVRAIEGEIYDVAVDIRRGSPTFGRWVGVRLSGANRLQLWVPPDFAHGYQVLSERAVVGYKATETYHPEADGGVRWDDPEIGIAWPIGEPVLSDKDANLPTLREAELPAFGGPEGTGA